MVVAISGCNKAVVNDNGEGTVSQINENEANQNDNSDETVHLINKDETEQSVNDGEESTLLKGTKWKLVGIVDSETNTMEVLEPKDCEKCYTLMFDSDKYAYAGYNIVYYSASNELVGNYEVNYATQTISFTRPGGTKIAEMGDGDMLREIIPTIQSFLFQGNELRLYNNSQKNYLLFKTTKL